MRRSTFRLFLLALLTLAVHGNVKADRATLNSQVTYEFLCAVNADGGPSDPGVSGMMWWNPALGTFDLDVASLQPCVRDPGFPTTFQVVADPSGVVIHFDAPNFLVFDAGENLLGTGNATLRSQPLTSTIPPTLNFRLIGVQLKF